MPNATTLRPYQVTAIQAVQTGLMESGRALLQMATGLGKTVVATEVIRVWVERGCKVAVLAHTQPIVDMFHNRLENGLGVPIDLLHGDRQETNGGAVTCATFQSAHRLYAEAFDLVVVDEAHHAPAATYAATLARFTRAKMFGMTATPDRADEKDIRTIFGSEVFTYSLNDGILNGWLATVDYRLVSDGISAQQMRDLAQRLQEGERLTREQVNRILFVEERLDAMTAKVRDVQAGGKKTIIFCSSIPHAREVASNFTGAMLYHSAMDRGERDESMDHFRSSAGGILVTVNMVNEGVDIPEAELLVFLRSTASMTIWLQQMGRGTRLTDSKRSVTVLDFVGNCERIGMIRQTFQGLAVNRDSISVHDAVVVESGWTIHLSEELLELENLLAALPGRDFYSTWEEASTAAQALGIRDYTEYIERHKEDTRLPRSPNKVYVSSWKQRGKWLGFLGRSSEIHYPTWEEASAAARALGICNCEDYIERHRKDGRLVSAPDRFYPDWKERGRWLGFLGRSSEIYDPYPTWEEASAAARALGIRSSGEYVRGGYKKDPRLASNPSKKYSNWNERGGWIAFLDTGNKKAAPSPNPYPTWEEASAAARALGIRSSTDYARGGYKKDPRLVSAPDRFYPDWKERGGWPGFLNTKK